jgi:hypothetical protein
MLQLKTARAENSQLRGVLDNGLPSCVHFLFETSSLNPLPSLGSAEPWCMNRGGGKEQDNAQGYILITALMQLKLIVVFMSLTIPVIGLIKQS